MKETEAGGLRSWMVQPVKAGHIAYREVEERAHQLNRSSRSLLFEFCRNDLSSVAWYLAAIESGHAVALLSDRLAPALRDNLIERYRPDWIYSSTSQQLESTTEAAGQTNYIRQYPCYCPPQAVPAVRNSLEQQAEHRSQR